MTQGLVAFACDLRTGDRFTLWTDLGAGGEKYEYACEVTAALEVVLSSRGPGVRLECLCVERRSGRASRETLTFAQYEPLALIDLKGDPR